MRALIGDAIVPSRLGLPFLIGSMYSGRGPKFLRLTSLQKRNVELRKIPSIYIFKIKLMNAGYPRRMKDVATQFYGDQLFAADNATRLGKLYDVNDAKAKNLQASMAGRCDHGDWNSGVGREPDTSRVVC